MPKLRQQIQIKCLILVGLVGQRPEQPPERGSVRFRTDRLAICLLTLTASLDATQRPYVVFCGGSTTDSDVVSEGHLSADMFTCL